MRKPVVNNICVLWVESQKILLKLHRTANPPLSILLEATKLTETMKNIDTSKSGPGMGGKVSSWLWIDLSKVG